MNQPTTHDSQSKCLEKILCRNYDLTQEELAEFYALRTKANALFSPQSPNSLQPFRGLYSKYFGRPCPEDITTRDWIKLGFQGDRPQRDLRGGGLLALDLIIAFVDKNIELVREMEKEENDFFFAISAINIAFFMKKYFHLADFLQPGLDRLEYCSRRALKNFTQILQAEKETYQKMHQMLLVYLFKRIWLSMKQDRRNVTLLHFNQAFDNLKNRVRRVLDGGDYYSWRQFQQSFST